MSSRVDLPVNPNDELWSWLIRLRLPYLCLVPIHSAIDLLCHHRPGGSESSPHPYPQRAIAYCQRHSKGQDAIQIRCGRVPTLKHFPPSINVPRVFGARSFTPLPIGLYDSRGISIIISIFQPTRTPPYNINRSGRAGLDYHFTTGAIEGGDEYATTILAHSRRMGTSERYTSFD